jgi:acetyl esterase/lipase
LTVAYHPLQDFSTNIRNPHISPLLATSHQGLPAAYLQVAGMDLLRDEGMMYEQVLRESGVKTKIDMSVEFFCLSINTIRLINQLKLSWCSSWIYEPAY